MREWCKNYDRVQISVSDLERKEKEEKWMKNENDEFSNLLLFSNLVQ